MKRVIIPAAALLLAGAFMSSCGERSAATGFKYNDTKWGGFENVDYKGQPTGPNLVLV